MNEKQRWLLRDLEQWQTKMMESIGKYGPQREPKPPERVLSAKRAIKRHEETVRNWEKQKRQPWNKQKDVIEAKYRSVKRTILFEKTEVALKELKALVGK